MGSPLTTQFNDLDAADTAAGSSGWRHPLKALRRLAAAKRAPQAPRDSGEATTQPPPTRGQALREAHRTLRQRLRAHPATRQVMPHLAALERSLAKHGTRALQRLSVPVLQRALEQLAMLQQDDEAPHDAMNLRVLRLRVIETIALRSSQSGAAEAAASGRAGAARRAPAAAPSTLAGFMAPGSSLPGLEVSELGGSTCVDIDSDWTGGRAAPQLRHH